MNVHGSVDARQQLERLRVGETQIRIRVVFVNLYVVAVDLGTDPVRHREDCGEQFLFRPAIKGRLHHVRLELTVDHIDRPDVLCHIKEQRRDPELHCRAHHRDVLLNVGVLHPRIRIGVMAPP